MLKKYSIVKYLEKLPSQILEVIFLSRDLAKREQISVYLVGGFVRDLLLGVENLDLDIVVEKEGINFANKLSALLDARLIKHRDFGTATVIKKDGFKIDVATCRKEFYPKPAALPIVRPGIIEDDLFRRDFTINAIACNIGSERYGQLVDLFEGIKDLRQGRIRFLHQESFIDDPTRIMRAVRFEQRFGFIIESRTLHFIKQAKKLNMLEKVGKHRIRGELVLIFKEKNPYKILNRLNSIYNLTFIDKNIKLINNTKRIFSAIDRAGFWFKNNFPQRRNLDIWLMYLMFLLFNFEVRKLRKFSEKYAFNRNQAIRIISFRKEFKKIDEKLSKKYLSAVKLHGILNFLSYEVILLTFAISRKYKTKQRIKDFFVKYHRKKLLITGDDLLSLGVVPGPEFKKIFKAVLRAKINGLAEGRKEELELAKKIISSK